MKLVICGSVGSGKTTTAKRLSAIWDTPAFSGDSVTYGYAVDSVPAEDGRFKRTEEEQAEVIDGILGYDAWIFEGVYRPAQRALFDAADRIVLLDVPFRVRRRRILMRWVKQKLHIEHADYAPNFRMLRNMLRWNRDFEDGTDKTRTVLSSDYADKVLPAQDAADIIEELKQGERS